MDRHELDLTDTDVIEISITQAGGIVNMYIRTKDKVIELVIDVKDFAEFQKSVNGVQV